MPAPKLVTSFPVGSNFNTLGSLDILPVARSRQLFAPQRSATQTDLPSLSISTALVEPHVRPSGSLKKSFIVRYGFGALLTGRISCADEGVTGDVAMSTAVNSKRKYRISDLKT